MTNFRPATLGNEGAQVGFKGIERKGGASDHAERRGGVTGHRAEATHLFRRTAIDLVKMLSSKCGRATPIDAGFTRTARGRCGRSCGPTQWQSQASGPCHSKGPALGLDRWRPNRVNPTMTPAGDKPHLVHSPLLSPSIGAMSKLRLILLLNEGAAGG